MLVGSPSLPTGDSARAAYETYKGSWEGTFFHDWAQMCTRPDPVLFDRMQVFLHRLDATNWAVLPLYMVSTAELCGQSGDVATAAVMLERAAEIVNLPAPDGAKQRLSDCTLVIARAMPKSGRNAALQPGDCARTGRQALGIADGHGYGKAIARPWGSQCRTNGVTPVYGWFTEGLETQTLWGHGHCLMKLRRRYASSQDGPELCPPGSGSDLPLLFWT